VFAGAEGVKTASQERVFGGAAGSWYDPCYHQACDDLNTVFTGIPPLDAQGLIWEDETPTVEEAQAAANKMEGGALRGLNEMSDGASYAVWYFSSTKNPWGSPTAKSTKVRAKKAKKYRKSRALRRVERFGYGDH
jgi:hypothetical protein